MEIGAVTRSPGLDAVAAAWADAARGAAGIVDGEPNAGAAQAPGAAADHTVEAATVQNFARSVPLGADALRPSDLPVPTPAHPGSEFALPADQLVPAALVGLQVDPSALWAMTRQPGVERRRDDEGSPRREREAQPEDEPGADDDAPKPEHEPMLADPHAWIGEASIDEAPPWAEPLARTLRIALASPAPPPALTAAAHQWLRGRSVVLVCPKARDPESAWAFVLWPRRGDAEGLMLRGTRVQARLQWSGATREPWILARAMKEHHPRRGRQLVVREGIGRCDVQLGPVIAQPPRRCDLHIRIDAVRPFWAALGAQWSVTLLACAAPLLEGDGEAP